MSVGGLVGGMVWHCEQLLFHRQRDWQLVMLAVWWEAMVVAL